LDGALFFEAADMSHQRLNIRVGKLLGEGLHDLLSDADIQALVAHIRSFKK
jgi:cytochrome c553